MGRMKVLSHTRTSITHPTQPHAVEIEPFDEALDRHIWSLSDQRLKWDREIARTRAEKPKEVETMLQDLFDRQHEVITGEIDPVTEERDSIQDDRE